MTQTDRTRLADAYAAISASGASGLTAQALRDRGHMAATWTIETLLAQNMIVRLRNTAGVCVDGRYATIRNASR